MKPQKFEHKDLEELLRRAQQGDPDTLSTNKEEDIPGEALPTEKKSNLEKVENPDETAKNGTNDRRKRRKARDARARKAFDSLIEDEEEEEPIDFSIRGLLGGDMLGARWFLRQVPFLLLLSVMAIFYVSNRYSCQRAEIQQADLKNRLDDRRLKALTISSELTQYTMRQNIENILPDSTLRTSTTSFYQLK